MTAASAVVDHRRDQRDAQSGATRRRDDEDVGQVGDRDASRPCSQVVMREVTAATVRDMEAFADSL